MFIHLRVHSDYSLLAGTIKVDQLVTLAYQNKMPAIALTDTSNLFGSLEFSEYACQNAIQPIIGCDLSIIYGELKTTILLLVQNEIGYKNLLHLLYDSSINNINLDDLTVENAKGIIALSGGILSDHLFKSPSSDELIKQLIKLFPNNLYIELQRLADHDQQIESNLINIAYQYNLPLVATNKILFAQKDDYEAHDALTCIAQGNYISDEGRQRLSSEHYFKSPSEMQALFADIPEAVTNTVIIARRCAFMVESCQPTLPEFPCKVDENTEIKKQAYDGLHVKLDGNIPTEYLQRMEYELQVITRMKYSGYFLIVSDFIKWSKNNDIPVGPGRGSGVGSIVAWSLQITDLDPIKFGLLFERFLNPDRVSMPDFDIDFCQHKRDLVIKYIQKKYGHVAQIITFGKLQPRAVLRDVGRVLQIPYFQVDKICKMIPHNPVSPVNLLQAIKLDKELQKARDNDETIATLLTISLKLEGLYRHASTHAAGIVISSKPLIDSVPIFYDQATSLPITQYSMKYVEKAGLVKFDFLGLKTLTIIHNTCNLIGNNFNIHDIKLDDKKTFDLLSNGDSVGVFQLENAFMRQTLKRLQPDCLEDIIALISLNRPGPMDNIPTYIARKHGKEEIEYIHPKLQDTLKETFGVVIYQEQVMEIARVLAGYTLGEADLLRRAMGKKIKSEMNMQRDIFVKGAMQNGIEKYKATDIFNLVAKFAGYGFNKSHAAAYALISYQTAYLKANYLVEFLTACMNLDINDTDKLQLFCNEAKRHKVEVLPPDINHSQPLFTVEDNAIRYGLGALKSVGISAIEEVCHKQYKDIFDFVNNTKLNKRAIESLAKAGAFDSIHNNRQQIYKSAERISHNESSNNSMQKALFDDQPITQLQLVEVAEWQHDEKLQCEFESIGFFLRDHPLDKYKTILENIQLRMTNMLAGIITKVRMRSSERGRFCIIAISHPEEIYDIAFYDNEVVEKYRDLFVIGQAVAIEMTKGENGIRGNSITALENFISANLFNITVYLHNHDLIPQLKNIFSEKGNTKVTVRIDSNSSEFDIELPDAYRVDLNAIIKMKGMSVK